MPKLKLFAASHNRKKVFAVPELAEYRDELELAFTVAP
jgi:hypothetical protein